MAGSLTVGPPMRIADRILPVLVIDDAAWARPVGEALVAGGLATVEVTLRTDAAIDAIAAMSSVSGLTVGAGTVRNVADLHRAARAGARFAVSPGFDREIVEEAQRLDLPLLPGVATASEAQAALAAGLTEVKVFPAGLLGGPSFLRALAGPFPELRFWPSGGVGPDDVASYLAVGAVRGVCGSWMVARDLLERQDWPTVERLSRDAVGSAAP